MLLPVLQFGPFELDRARYELRRAGLRVKLQPVPMDLLILLVDRRGELVTRDEIVSHLWNAQVEVDAERSVNTAIRKVRRALGDDADRPRFVETVVGKGYRFLAPVTPADDSRAATPPLGAALSQTDVPPSRPAGLSSPLPEAVTRRWRIGAAAIGLSLLAGIAIGLTSTLHRPEPMRITPFTAMPGSESAPSFSPSGNQVAFTWESETGDRRHLYVKDIAAGSAVRLTPESELDSDPAWSPDGRWIAFLRQTKEAQLAVYAVAALGGQERQIRILSHLKRFRPAWSPDGSSLAILDADPPSSPLGAFLISLDSASIRRLTPATLSGIGDSAPAFSPDGSAFAFLRTSGRSESSAVFTIPVKRNGVPAGSPRKVAATIVDFLDVQWSGDGHSFICSTRTGLVRLPLAGGAVERLPFLDVGQLSVARGGGRVVFAREVRDTDIVRIPGPGTAGSFARLITSTRRDGGAKYSPDGSRIVFASGRTGTDQIWTAGSNGETAMQLTSLPGGSAGSPRWSPDGRRIAFDVSRDGLGQIYVIGAQGGAALPITAGSFSNVRPSWSADGNWIYFGSNRSGAWEIWKARSDGKEAPVRVTQGGAREAFEDSRGSFLYYAKPTPVTGIWRVPTAGGSPEQVTSGGSQGRWAIGRRGLYYLNEQNELELLDLQTRRSIAIPTPGLRLGFGFGGGVLGIAPDDLSILVTALSRTESDLALIENFR